MQKLKEKIKNEPIIFLFRKMWQFAGERKKKIILSTAFFVISNIIDLLNPLVLAVLLNEIQTNGINDTNIRYLMLIMIVPFVIMLSFWFFHGFGRILERQNSYYQKEKYREYLMLGIMNLPLSWHAEKDSGDTIDKINNAITAGAWITSSTFIFVRIIIKLLGGVVVLFLFKPIIAFISIILIFFTFYILSKFDAKLTPEYKQLNKMWNTVSAKVFDLITNITSITVLNIQKPVLKSLKKLALEPFTLFNKNIRLHELKWFTGSIMMVGIVTLPILIYLYDAYINNLVIQVGTLSALYLYLSRLSSSFSEFSNVYGNTILNKAKIENAKEIECAIETNQKTQQKKQKIKDWNTLKISDLNFSYHQLGSPTSKLVKTQDLHLNNVNITIKKGERIAFIGESGSGKTTFLKVLHGLYDSASAKLAITNNNDTNPVKLRHGASFTNIDLATMLVPQEPEIFSSTIKENITLGLPTKAKELKRVIKLARFNDVVAKLPKGLKSVINEKGVNLSGGQKQRLALARALLFAQDKQVLLLDESTSSVDPENEAHIYEDIFNEYKTKTILASIHKMNLLKYFDRIVMFEDGRIVDEGTFDELLKKNEKFKGGWESFVRGGV